MIEKLSKLYNTLLTIETKGENTKTMGVCLQFLEGMIAEEKQKQFEELSKAEKADENMSKE